MRSLTPHPSRLYRVVQGFTRSRLAYRLRQGQNQRRLALTWLTCAGSLAFVLLTATAWVTRMPLLFPPLGASAFILFWTPMAAAAAPRNLVLGHLIGLAAGCGFAWLCGRLLPGGAGLDPTRMDWILVIALGLSFSATSLGMVLLDCSHPPAAATAVLAAMGMVASPGQLAGFILAVVLLAGITLLFNRLLGGLPYPWWRSDVRAQREYESLTGAAPVEEDRWSRSRKVLMRPGQGR